MPLNPRRKFN